MFGNSRGGEIGHQLSESGKLAANSPDSLSRWYRRYTTASDAPATDPS